MDFAAKVKDLSARIEKLAPSIKTEEGTKTSLIMPFRSKHHYDDLNPLSFIP